MAKRYFYGREDDGAQVTVHRFVTLDAAREWLESVGINVDLLWGSDPLVAMAKRLVSAGGTWPVVIKK